MGFGLTDIANGIASLLGVETGLSEPKTDTVMSKTPSSGLTRKIQTLKPENWDQNLPYFFGLGEANKKGSVTNTDPSNSIFKKEFNKTKFILAIPPTNISITTQHAINVVATNGGILEEHNGTVFRIIQISGTTGVFPRKSNRGKKPSGPGAGAAALLNTFAPAATSAINGLVNQVSQGISALGLGSTEIEDIKKDLKDSDLVKTGYYQFWELYKFILAYTEFKKKKKTANIRLLFGSVKDNVTYVVTPMSFELKRDASTPLLYHYSITLKAWDIVPQSVEVTAEEIDIPTPDSVSVIASVTNILRSARSVIQSARGVLSGIHSDIESIFNVYNQGLILLSDTAGLANDVGNFASVFNNRIDKILANSDNNRQKMQNTIKAPSESGISGKAQVANNINNFLTASSSPSASTASIIANAGAENANVNASGVASNKKSTPGGEDKATNNQSISNQAHSAAQAALNTETFQNLTLDELDLPEEVQQEIDDQRQEAQSLTAGDMRTLIGNLNEINDNYIISINAMDSTYASTYNIPYTPTASNKVPTEDEILTAVALEESKRAFKSTLATGEIFKEREPDPFLAANQAIPPEDQVITPFSAVSVPFERGLSLEKLAQKYLGEAKRSREIEILNGLRTPYIDEVGFSLSISGASGRSFVVDTSPNLTINQFVTISSNAVASTRRKILNIESIGGSKSRVTVNGQANLEIYSSVTMPMLSTRLPGTVGPGDTLLIPSEDASDDVFSIRPTQLYNQLSHSEKVFKVDLALSRDGQDLDVGANGDVKRSFGYNNAIQSIRLAVEVEQGELESHTNYGLPIPLGSRNSSVSITDVEEAITNTISADPRFVGANVNVEINGSVANVDILAIGAAGTGQIPVSFDIGRI